MKLGAKQEMFAALVSRLIARAVGMGLGVRGGEWFRPKEMAAIYAARGMGIKNSLHCQKLAIDLYLFQADGSWATDEQYAKLGAWWKRQHGLCRWGGDFRRYRDVYHFSVEHRGIR